MTGLIIFETPPSRAVTVKYMCIRYSHFEVNTPHYACHVHIPDAIGYHRWTCLFFVSLLKFSFMFPTTYGAHTRPPATSSHAPGRLTESILEEGRQ